MAENIPKLALHESDRPYRFEGAGGAEATIINTSIGVQGTNTRSDNGTIKSSDHTSEPVHTGEQWSLYVRSFRLPYGPCTTLFIHRQVMSNTSLKRCVSVGAIGPIQKYIYPDRFSNKSPFREDVGMFLLLDGGIALFV